MNENNEKIDKNKRFNRRDFLKSVATLPVFGGFVAAVLAKRLHDQGEESKIFADLGIDTRFTEAVPEQAGKSNDVIRLGIIGVGNRGTSILEALGYCVPKNEYDDVQRSLNVTVSGICDVYDEFAEKAVAMSQRNRFHAPTQHSPAKRYHHYQELLKSKEIDAVIIATPDHWHSRMVIDAVSAGKHIYCEKCLTRTLDEAYQVYDAVNKSSIIFQYGHQNRQQDSYRIARQIIEKKILGNITLVKTHTNRNTPRGAWVRHLDKKIDLDQLDWREWLGADSDTEFTPSRFFGWQKFFEYSAGLPAHMFSHEYDAINQVMDLGIPKSVMSMGGIYYWKDDRNTPDVLQCLFEYPDRGLILTYDATLASSSTGEYETGAKVKEIFGSDAWMKLGMNFHVVVDRHSRRYGQKIEKRLMTPTAPFLSYTTTGNIDAVTSASDKYYASQGLVYTYKGGKRINVTYLHVREWLDGIRHGIVPSCTIDLAFQDTITCLMATKSYQEGRNVEWDPVKKIVI
jgi:predicted dehydrogenase